MDPADFLLRRNGVNVSRPQRIAAPIALALALALGACSQDGAAPVPDPESTPASSQDSAPRPNLLDATLQGEVIVVDHSDSTSLLAGLTAPLARVGSCIGLGGTLVIWPDATTWDAATSTLTLADGDTFTLGEEMQTGGGSFTSKALAGYSEKTGEALTQCGAAPEQAIWVMT
ncbi:hypothetical protein [Kineococcus sp. SYSU DK001]|uniref:hypothetical protein n=1 Tax=Kineococcus sp. SYSU DK001 TaxID=3383122 RepID=UPI003D7E40E5